MSGSVIQFPLRLGLVEDANKKSAPVSSLKRGHNVRCVRDGVLGKRFGYDQMGNLPEDSVPVRIVTRGEELSYIDYLGTLYTWSPASQVWHSSDRIGDIGLEWTTLIDDESGVAQSDVVVSGNILLHAYMAGDPSRQDGSQTSSVVAGAVYVQAIDWHTGRVLLPPTYIGNALFIRLLLCGNYAVLLTSIGAEFVTPQILSYRIALMNESGGAVALINDVVSLATDVRYDGDPHGLNSRFDALYVSTGQVVLAYESATSLQFRGFDVVDGELSANGLEVAIAGQNYIRAIALCEMPPHAFYSSIGNGRVLCSYCVGNDLNPTCFVKALTIVTTNFSVDLGAADINGGIEFRAHHISAAYVGPYRAAIIFSGINQTSTAHPWPETRSVVLNFETTHIEPETLRVSAGVMMTSGFVSIDSSPPPPDVLVDEVEPRRLFIFARDANYGEYQRWDASFGGDILPGAELGTADLARLPSMSSYLIEVETSVRTDFNTRVPHRVVGKIDHDIAAPFEQGFTSRPASQGFLLFGVVPFQATAAPESFNFRSGLRLVTTLRVDSTPTFADPYRSVTIGGLETYIAGAGMLFAWDGRTVFDHAMRTPMIIGIDPVADLGHVSDGGTSGYTYQTFAAYRSHAGLLHRGPMSAPATILFDFPDTDAGSVRLTILPNSIDSKETVATGFGGAASLRSAFNIFRTEKDGSILYERTFGPRFETFLNLPTEPPQTFLDSRNDSNITDDALLFRTPDVPLASRPQPYVATGELEDVQPPAASTTCLHLDRIFLVAGDGRTLWFSKATGDNPGIAPGFNPDFVRIFDREVTALASHADRLIIFFERGAKFMVGDGPTVSNTDDRFSTPQSLQGEIGTTNPRSVVATPVGVFFQATGGEIYLLDGGLSMQWVGKDARDVLAAYPTITSAVHVAEQHEVRFTCNSLGGDSIVLAFDYQRGMWMTRSTPYDSYILDATLWDGKYVIANEHGLFFENTARHADLINSDSVYVSMSIVLNPIAPSGPLAWHRIRLVQLIGKSVDPHQLTIGLARDFSETVEQERTWNGSSDVTSNVIERAQVAPKHQKMQAIEIHISDAAPTFDGGDEHDAAFNGFELDGVALLVQTKQDLARIEKSKRG